MTLVGELSLWIALVMAVWCAVISAAGAIAGRPELVRSGERAANAAAAFGVLAAVGIWQALHQRDFSYAFVAGHITANMPDAYVFAALWSGSAGASLLWSVLLAVATAGAAHFGRSRGAPVPVATAMLGAVVALSFAMVALTVNPFERLPFAPADGDGMNPQLQNPAMLLHPPLLLTGLALTAPPFALGVSAALQRALSLGHAAAMERWLRGAWVVLSGGILSGMWWAYVEPGWGGYWSWDPAQTAALLPWLGCIAATHALTSWARNRAFSRWTVALAMLPFLSGVLAACVVRGAAFETLHSFLRASGSSSYAGLLVVASVGATWALFVRAVTLRSATSATGVQRRDAAMLYGNVLIVVIAFIALTGLLFPLFAEWMTGAGASLGSTYFNRIIPPIAVLLLAAIVAATVFRPRASPPLGQRAARIASHAGFAILILGFTGMRFSRTFDVSLTAGQAFDATDPLGRFWRFTSQGLSLSQRRNSEVQSVSLELRRDAKPAGFLTSEQRQYVDTQRRPVFDPTTESAVRIGLWLDTYVVLAAVHDEVADIRITFNPLVVWVWVGGALVIIGGVLTMLPGRNER